MNIKSWMNGFAHSQESFAFTVMVRNNFEKLYTIISIRFTRFLPGTYHTRSNDPSSGETGEAKLELSFSICMDPLLSTTGTVLHLLVIIRWEQYHPSTTFIICTEVVDF